MKFFLVLSAIFALAAAGGKTLSPEESAEHLRNFKLFCSPNAGRSGQDADGNTMYYCKTADEPITLKIDHEQELNGGETPKQVIYVQPPPYVYRHNVGILGSPGSPQETSIYVLPQTATHQLSINDQRSRTQATKPQLYFLSGTTGNSDSTEYSGGNVGAIPNLNRANVPNQQQQQLSPGSVSASFAQQAPASFGTGPSGGYSQGQSYLPPRPANFVQPYTRTQRNAFSNGKSHYNGSQRSR